MYAVSKANGASLFVVYEAWPVGLATTLIDLLIDRNWVANRVLWIWLD